MMTTLAPAKAYIQPDRKARLDRIVEATSHRMTISKLMDEAVEMVLPQLEQKYGTTFSKPTQDAPGKRRRPA